MTDQPPPSPQSSLSSTRAATTATMSPPNQDLSHFLTLPWCAALLSAPGTTLLPVPSRIPKASTEDSLFAITLRTGSTIPYMLSFSSPRAAASPAGTEEVCTLFALGDGGNGYPATAHGGLIAALFDEAMGVSMMRLRASANDPKCAAGSQGGTDIVTASLGVDFVKMLGTPGVVVVRVWVAERRGRKWVLESEMEDSEGVVARGKAVWVEIKSRL